MMLSRFVAIVLWAFLGTSQWAHAQSSGSGSDFLLHHIKDGHTWHFATIGQTHVTLHLPIILYSTDRGVECFSSRHFFEEDNHPSVTYRGYQLDIHDRITPIDPHRKIYDLSITKNIAAMLLSMAVLLAAALTTRRAYRQGDHTVPRGFSALMESLICFVRDDIARPNIGVHYARFMPYLLTVFFFIWINNLMGLLPGAANVTGNISITFGLAFYTFLLTNLNGNAHYWQHIFRTPGVPWWLSPIMVPIELLGICTKPFSLMVRLFANITAGHIILLSIVGLIFILQSAWIGLVSVPFGAFMFLLKLLVSFLQAYIFTLLSAIYFGAAVEESH